MIRRLERIRRRRSEQSELFSCVWTISPTFSFGRGCEDDADGSPTGLDLAVAELPRLRLSLEFRDGEIFLAQQSGMRVSNAHIGCRSLGKLIRGYPMVSCSKTARAAFTFLFQRLPCQGSRQKATRRCLW